LKVGIEQREAKEKKIKDFDDTDTSGTNGMKCLQEAPTMLFGTGTYRNKE